MKKTIPNRPRAAVLNPNAREPSNRVAQTVLAGGQPRTLVKAVSNPFARQPR